MINLENIKSDIEQICMQSSVKRLGIFGSVLTDQFTPDSDIDVLVVFDADKNTDLFLKYFDLKERLEKLFNRKVDLVIDKKFRNPIFNNVIEKTRLIIYER